MSAPQDDVPEPSPIRQGFTARLGEFAIYVALAAGGALIILWLLANT